MKSASYGNLDQVRGFWNKEACGTHFVTDASSDQEFFEKYRDFRYRTEWHIPKLVPFAEAQGKSVLEIGCGNGADGVQFAKNGADYTGVDLTPAAVDATRRHFAVLGLPGRFQVENAEKLSFADASFDWVYSHGVLHHSPHPDQTFAEVYRVLKPGGRMILMLYHRNSFNYWVRILGYMRTRAMLAALLRAPSWKRDRAQALEAAATGIRGNTDSGIWGVHYRGFLKQGWKYFSSTEFAHHCTDGPECPYAFTYSEKELREKFAHFKSLEFKVAHFPLRKYPGMGWLPKSMEQALASRLGWYLFIYGVK